ncbi:MAG: SDR family oxidoreductase, partial [Opitutales bacterium]|nr:SDR family oxidoreductase [Opitutales bacterium]
CSQLGARVALVGRNEERLAESMKFLEGEGHAFFSADLREVEAIESLVSRIVGEIGPIGGLVHSAGVSNNRPLKLLKPSQHADLYAINVLAAFEMVRSLQKKGADGCGGVFRGVHCLRHVDHGRKGEDRLLCLESGPGQRGPRDRTGNGPVRFSGELCLSGHGENRDAGSFDHAVE